MDRGSTVLVTGGTGYVGARIVADLVAAGQRVRVLARNLARLPPALRQYGNELPDRVGVTLGDATDERAVATAVRGCDAVVHAAAVFSFDRSKRAEMIRTNRR